MKLGIKVGLKNDSLRDLDQTQAPACEVWYNASIPDAYKDLFSKLSQKNIDVGIHYWGSLPDQTTSNIAYPDRDLNEASMEMIIRTIDTAKHYGFKYVNIHPGNNAIVKVDFERMDYPYVSEPCDVALASANFRKNAAVLSEYAAKLDIIFTVETVCPYSPKTNWYNETSRLKPFRIYDLPIDVVQAAVDQSDIYMANDFVHTAANCIEDNRMNVWQYLYDFTKRNAPKTKLIHLGFLIPPYNGMDHHGMLDNPLIDTQQAVPNKDEIIKLFQLFTNRNDVWVITEPKKDHVNNYFIAQSILKKPWKDNLLRHQN